MMSWDSAPNLVIPEGLTESGPLLPNVHRPEDTRAAVETAVYAILGHGSFQRRIMACSLLSMVVLLCHSLAYRAIASPVDHWCARPPNLQRVVTVQTWKNVAIPVEPDGSLSRCDVYDPPMPASGGDDTRRVVSCTEWEYATKFRNRSIVSEWDMVCHQSRRLQLSSAMYMAGAMLGVPFAGLLSDRAGRKPVITGCVTALVFASVGCSVTRSFVVFVIARMVVSAMSSATQESPSWLLATWKLKRAEEVLLVAARRNGLVVEKAVRFFRKLKAEMRRHAHAFLVEASAAAGAALAAKKTAVPKSLAAEFLSGWRAMSVFLAWFTVMFCYYGLMLADEEREGARVRLSGADIVYVLALVPVVTCTYVGMQFFGQRRTFTVLLALLFEATAMLMVMPQDSAWAPTMLFKVAARAVTAAATSANYVYTAEAFPISVRSTGLTVSYASGRLGAIFATALMSLQVSYTRPFMNVAMMLLALVTVMAVQIAPEGPPRKRDPGSGGGAAAAGANPRGRSFGWEIRGRGSRDASPHHTSTLRSSLSRGRASSGGSLMHGMPYDQHAWKVASETVEP
ncbi:organic anion transporter 3-like isoform X2 [Amblyomma americanum]